MKNGMGYPMGLSGEQIPLEARINASRDISHCQLMMDCEVG